LTPAATRSIIRPLAGAAFAVGAIMVVVLSLLPQDIAPHVDVGDKVQHLIAYLCLALAGGIAFPDRRFLLALGLGLIALGVSLEIAQAFVPGRFASIGDVAANTLGVAVGLAIARLIPRVVENNSL